MRVALERIIAGELAHELLRTHRLLFDELDELAIQAQSMPDELFLEMLAHQNVLEIVGWSDQGRAHGLLILTNDLDLIPWINPRFLTARYPQHAARDLIYYVPCLQVHPDAQKGPLVRSIVEAASRYVGYQLGVLAFDSCQWDIENLGVPDFIARWSGKLLVTEYDEIDAQRYFAYNTTAVKEIDLRDVADDDVVIDLTEPAHDARREAAPR